MRGTLTFFIYSYPNTVNRIGQTREVNVFRLVATGTIEESVLSIQARKSQLIREARKDITGRCLRLLQSRRFPTQKLLPKHASALDLVFQMPLIYLTNLQHIPISRYVLHT